ncbi:hypothetical protein BRC81_01510 [Halobacteriales archaeon QS_1_68_20]|nr:MAG: hypothetical protein BRC81_01510 [Halobacteriales archaeon QS_1_68_20]
MVTGKYVATVAGKALAAVMALLVVLALVTGGLVAAGVVDVAPPTVESVESEWGQVTENSTGLRTQVVVDNPNPVGLPGVLSVKYTASMNDVVLVSGKEGGVGLSSGETTIELTGRMDNDRIVQWWVDHVNNGEQSGLEITAEVDGPLGISKTVPVREATFETDLLGHLAEGGPTEVTVDGETVLRVSDRQASWGQADAEETPVTFSATVENLRDEPISVDGFGYEVKMNDVVIGTGETAEGVDIAPGSSERVEVQAVIDTQKMADWWASHVRNGEETNLSVSVYGYVEDDGERQRLPMNVVDEDIAFSTDFLAGGEVTVRPIDDDGQSGELEPPSITGIDQQWGQVTDDVTEVRSTVTVQNPNDGEFGDALTVQLEGTTKINDVVVADDRTTVDGIDPGRSTVTHVTEMDNSKVPEWWARHVNIGEQSTFVTETEASVDAGFTTFEVPVQDQQGVIETDMLGGLEDDESQSVTAGGSEVAVIHSTDASWGHATPEVTPLTLEATVENTGSVPLTLRELQYHVAFNDVVVADATAPESHVIEPGETKTITFTLHLDSSKMDEWWVSHVRNGEVTTATFESTVTVEAGGYSTQYDLAPAEQTVETDVLNGTTGTRLQSIVAV